MSGPRRRLRVAIALCVIFILLPMLVTLIVATTENSARGLWADGFTLKWFAIASQEVGPTFGRSLLVAVGVVAVNLFAVGFLALWLARSSSLLAKVTAPLASLPLAVPGIAISVGLITAFPLLRPSGVLLFAGHVIMTLPFTLAALTAVFASEELQRCEDVATSLGASPMRVLRTITVPFASGAIMQAAITVFALSVGEFNISFFVNPPAAPMAPFALFDAYATQRLELASAKTVLFMLCVASPLFLIFFVRRLTRSRRIPQ